MADQGHNYPTGCLCYIYFQSYYKMIEVVLSKQQALDADQKAIQQINSTGNLDWAGNTTMFFITEEAKETISGIKNGTEIALNLSQLYLVILMTRLIVLIIYHQLTHKF